MTEALAMGDPFLKLLFATFSHAVSETICRGGWAGCFEECCDYDDYQPLDASKRVCISLEASWNEHEYTWSSCWWAGCKANAASGERWPMMDESRCWGIDGLGYICRVCRHKCWLRNHNHN